MSNPLACFFFLRRADVDDGGSTEMFGGRRSGKLNSLAGGGCQAARLELERQCSGYCLAEVMCVQSLHTPAVPKPDEHERRPKGGN